MKLKTLVAVSIFSLLPLTVAISGVPSGPHIVTSGIGSVDVVPDMATLTISVSALAKEASLAKNQVDQGVTKYFDFLNANGVEKKDINAANIQMRPEYDYNVKVSAETDEPEFKGYRAERTVQVTLRQLDKLNMLLDGALKSGLTGINAIELGSSKADTYQLEARKKAIEDAKIRARALVEGFDAKLGPIYRISYRAANVNPMPRLYAASAKMNDTAAGQTYEQSSISFSDNIDVIFTIKN